MTKVKEPIVSERQLLVAVVCSELYSVSHKKFLHTTKELEEVEVYCTRRKLIKKMVKDGVFYKITSKGKNRLSKLNAHLIKKNPELSSSLKKVDEFLNKNIN